MYGKETLLLHAWSPDRSLLLEQGMVSFAIASVEGYPPARPSKQRSETGYEKSSASLIPLSKVFGMFAGISSALRIARGRMEEATLAGPVDQPSQPRSG